MRDVTEQDASALLAAPLLCEDCEDWKPSRTSKGLLEAGCGLISREGVNLRLYVDMRFRRTGKTNGRFYMFSIFRRQPYGQERIYQLDIRQYPVTPRDHHLLPHEHIGSARQIGDAEWLNWTYDQVLAHFCARTNVTFIPQLPHPDEFRLRGQ